MQYWIGIVLLFLCSTLTACAPGTWTDSGKDIQVELNFDICDNQDKVEIFLVPEFLLETGDTKQTSNGTSNQSVNPSLTIPAVNK